MLAGSDKEKDVADASPGDSFFAGFSQIIGLGSSNTPSNAASSKKDAAAMAKL